MKRWFLVIGGGMLFGSFCTALLPPFYLKIVLIICVVIFLISIFFDIKTKVSTLVFMLFCFLGVFLITYKDVYIYENITSLNNSSKTITATVIDKLPSSGSNKNFSYNLYVTKIDNSDIKNFNTILYTNQFIDVDLYDEVSLTVTFFKPTSTTTFNGVNYYKSKNIYILSSCYDYTNEINIQVDKNNNKPLIYYIKSYNNLLSKIVENNFDINTSSIINAMILGNDDYIPTDLKSNYNDTGTSHIFAISGLHISILSLIIIRLLKKSPFFIRIFTPLFIILTYILLSGLHISSIRSGIMLLILMISKLFLRKSDLLNTLFLTGFIIVFINPYSIIDTSFQMSFSATLGIILFSDKTEIFLITKLRLYHLSLFVIKSVSVSFCANIFLIPFWIYTYKYVNILSPIVNLSITAFQPIILFLSFIYIIICPVMPHSLLNFFIDLFISLQNGVVEIFSNLDEFFIGLDYNNTIIWFEISLLATMIFVVLKNRKNLHYKHLCFCISFLFFASQITTIIDNKNSYLYVVGDGECSNIIIHHNSNTTIISTSNDDYIDIQTTNFLKGKGIKKIDNLIISYTNFNYYSDTFSLLDSCEVYNIFINKTNTNAKQLLTNKATSCTIYSIEDGMQIQLSNNLKIYFSYLIKNVNICINYNNLDILISNENYVDLNKSNTLFFVKGNVKTNYSQYDSIVYLLEKPYNDYDNTFSKPLYDGYSTFILN